MDSIQGGDTLFVYGTLRKGQVADLAKNAHRFCVQFLGKDAVNGCLYHLGSYPGLVLFPDLIEFTPSQPIVIGEAFYVQNASAGALLDAYECYPNLYDRTQIISKEGRLVWVYTYNGMVSTDQLIITGDWTDPRLSASNRSFIGG